MKILPLGDSALLVRLDRGNAGEVQRSLEKAALDGVIECVAAYDSVGVFYRGEETGFEALSAEVARVLSAKTEKASRVEKARTIEIPVCYEEEFAPDLPAVVRHTGLTSDEIARRHRAADYMVACVGFMPGFGYLRGLPNELSTPRRASPRKEVPAGAVAIGGNQTGVYPAASPGGWNIIGRTPLRLFDPASNPPALLRSGDRVQFRAISRAEFEASAR